MKILAHIPQFLPDHACGGELTIHDQLKAMQAKGHEVKVCCDKNSKNEFNGIQIETRSPADRSQTHKDLYEWADIIYTHLGKIGDAHVLCEKYDKPLIYYVHNTNNSATVRAKKIPVIYNSEWVKEELNFPVDNIVCEPFMFIPNYTQAREARYVTLVSLNQNKGGRFLKELANQLPDIPFIGVEGDYGKQETDQPDNVKIIKNNLNMQDVYAASKLIIVPSKYESYCRVAVEAMSAGIPVIANDTPGLRESCGDAAVYPDTGEWASMINKLYNGELGYKYFKAEVGKRAECLRRKYAGNANKFENFLENCILKK